MAIVRGNLSKRTVLLFVFALSLPCFAADNSSPAESAKLLFLQYALNLKKTDAPFTALDAPFLSLADPPSNKTVVCVQGMLDHPEAFKAMAAVYKRQGINVLALRLEGFSENLKGLERASLTQWRANIDEGLKIARTLGNDVSLLGYSFGGALALDAARRNPSAVNELVLLAPALKTNEASSAPGLFQRILEAKYPQATSADRQRFALIASNIRAQRLELEQALSTPKELDLRVTTVLATGDTVVNNQVTKSFMQTQSYAKNQLVEIDGVVHADLPRRQSRTNPSTSDELPSFSRLKTALGFSDAASPCAAAL